MKSFLSCFVVLAAGTLAVGQQPPPADTKKPADSKPASDNSINGSWTVVSAEKNGQPMPDAANMTVTVKDNTITCSGKDGKPAMTLKVDFGTVGHAKVTDQSTTTAGGADRPADRAGTGTGDKAMTREAVYVLTSDYLAVCVHDDKGTGGSGTGADKGTGTDKGTGAVTTSAPVSKSYCTILLKRGSGSDRR